MLLLPPNATAMERARAEVGAQLASLPVRIGDLKHPDTCPADWLPWLAWEWSVDVWSPRWSEAQKRAAIRASPEIHRRKGTVAAVKLALGTLDWDARLIEWHKTTPRGAPYTFAVELTLDRRGFEPELYDDVERLVHASKNLRSHLSRISLVHRSPAQMRVACAVVVAEHGRVLPYQPTAIRSTASLAPAAAVVTREFVSLHPQRN